MTDPTPIRLATHPPYGINIQPKRFDPALKFVFREKSVTFREVDGVIDIEYDPDALTESAQAFLDELHRLMGMFRR